MSSLTFGGGITLTGLGGASSLLGSSWLISRAKSDRTTKKPEGVLNQHGPEPEGDLVQQELEKVLISLDSTEELNEQDLWNLAQFIFPDKGVPGILQLKSFPI